MPESWKDFLSFSKSEKRGVIVLVALILLVSAFNWLMPSIISVDHVEIIWSSPEVYLAEKEMFDDGYESQADISSSKPKPKPKPKPFDFDPNSLDLDGWLKLGFSQKQAQSIINYRNAGAVFRIKSDLKKLFVIDEEKFEELKSFISLPEAVPDQPSEIAESREILPAVEVQIVELNTADTSTLKALPGIGPYFARKIVEYRESLGGYVDVDQLLEIWKMKEETVEEIRTRLTVDSTKVFRWRINQLEYDSLKTHPYLSYSIAKSLTAIREKHGPFSSLDDLGRSALMNDSIMQRLGPYLSFD